MIAFQRFSSSVIEFWFMWAFFPPQRLHLYNKTKSVCDLEPLVICLFDDVIIEEILKCVSCVAEKKTKKTTRATLFLALESIFTHKLQDIYSVWQKQPSPSKAFNTPERRESLLDYSQQAAANTADGHPQGLRKWEEKHAHRSVA